MGKCNTKCKGVIKIHRIWRVKPKQIRKINHKPVEIDVREQIKNDLIDNKPKRESKPCEYRGVFADHLRDMRRDNEET
jgi:hypothetical protein